MYYLLAALLAALHTRVGAGLEVHALARRVLKMRVDMCEWNVPPRVRSNLDPLPPFPYPALQDMIVKGWCALQVHGRSSYSWWSVQTITI